MGEQQVQFAFIQTAEKPLWFNYGLRSLISCNTRALHALAFNTVRALYSESRYCGGTCIAVESQEAESYMAKRKRMETQLLQEKQLRGLAEKQSHVWKGKTLMYKRFASNSRGIINDTDRSMAGGDQTMSITSLVNLRYRITLVLWV